MTAALSLGIALFQPTSPGVAASRIVLRAGPLQQTVQLEDLETFASTGRLPDRLRAFGIILTPEVRRTLQQRLNLDPQMSDRIIGDLLASPNGELLLDTLATIAPGLTPEQLQAAVRLAAMQADGLSLLSILRAIPQESLEVDLTAAIALISQFNLASLEGQALSSVLDHELLSTEPAPLALFDPAAPGPERVFQRTLTLPDRARARLIPVEVYWSRETQGPLIVLSHGFGADRYFLNYLAEHLASHGLTVVSIEHPGSDVDALMGLALDPEILQRPSRILPASEFLDRPRDVSFVLDELAELDRRSPVYRGKFNTEQVTLIGHSLGGYTGLALAGARLDLRSLREFCNNLQPLGTSPAAWLQCAAVDLPQQEADLSDSRVTQVVAMNPLTGRLFGPQGLSQITVPALIVAGTQDGVTPILSQQLTPFDQLSGPKYLAAVIGGTHLSVGDPNNVNPSLTQIPFMPELQGEEAASLRQFLRGVTLSFVNQQTAEADRYGPFLGAGYAQSFSTAQLPLRFTAELPSTVRVWLRLNQNLTGAPRSTAGLIVSWVHLETIDNHTRLQRVQQQVVAHLQASHAVTVLRWPLHTLALR